MSNSKLISQKKISPNKNTPRNHAIDRITPHVYVGQATIDSMGEWFAKSSAQCSCNYGIGTDGKIILIVDENDRSWCSSSPDNDHRAVTIECASNMKAPYAINDKVYASLVNLCVDICQRNGKKKLIWFADNEKTLNYSPDEDEMIFTVHRWFANKECPGDYVYNRLGKIADEVNEKLGNTDTSFSVIVSKNDVEIMPSAGTGKYTGIGTFTITEKNGNWGRLKSGAGWIDLRKVKKVKR